MSKKVDFELNRKGLFEFMKGDAMQKVMQKTAKAVMPKGDYEYNVHVGKTRANANLRCTSKDSYKDNLSNNTLLKAIGKI